MKRKLRKINTKKLCVIAMLLALTVVLSWLTGYLRTGMFSKISVSFIAVYFVAILYGPFAGCFAGIVADIISCLVAALGPPVLEVTILEGVYGVLFYVIFYRGKFFIKNIYIRVAGYSFVRFFMDIFLKTKILSCYGFVPENFKAAFIMRTPGCLAMLGITLVTLYIFEKYYADKFIKMVK